MKIEYKKDDAHSVTIALLIVLIAIVIAGVVGITVLSQIKNDMQTVITNQPAPTPTPKPIFTITNHYVSSTNSLIHHNSLYHYVYVTNSGDAGGYVTIKSQMIQGPSVEKQQTQYVGVGQSVCITFEYTEYSMWGSQASCRCWII